MKTEKRTLASIITEVKNIYSLARKYTLEIFAYTAMAFISVAVGLLSSVFVRNLIDLIMTTVGGRARAESIVPAALGVVLLSFASIAFNAVGARIAERIRLKINTELTAEVFSEFFSSSWERSSLYASGDILNRLNSDISTLAGSIIGILPTLFIKAFQFAAAFFIVLYYDKTMALISLITVPLTLIFSRFVIHKMHDYSKKLKKASSGLMAFNADALLNMQYIKSFGLINAFCVKLRRLQKEYVSLSLDNNKFVLISTTLMSLITQLVTYASFGWCIFRLWQNAISIGTLVLFVQLYGVLSGSFSSIAHVVPTLINAATASERLSEIRNLPKESSCEDDCVSALKEKKLGLSLEKVSFKYIGEDENALTGVDFNAGAGDFIALIGPSGEGKTTILRLLLALIEPKEGGAFICADGEKIRLSPATRRLFSYVPQKNTMFSDTLRANMLFVKPDATDEEIINALKLSCAYDFIAKEKDFLDCLVGDGGIGFSEGQLQRLSIARALLRDAPFVLFDEATSALDVDTEQRVLQNLAQWGKNKICIFTSHRPSVYEVCNKIYSVSDSHCERVL